MARHEGGTWQDVLSKAVAERASDVHLAVGQAVFFRVDGALAKQDAFCDEALMEDCLDSLLDGAQRQAFGQRRDMDFSWEAMGERFRGHAYWQRGRAAVALRHLPSRIPSLEELGAPRALQGLLRAEQGLCLVTGRTGAGKTTTLAAFLEALNRQRAAHVITLEDPIEFLHEPKECFFSQRELGRDFASFPSALKSALREMPDVMLVGEIREAETMETALMAAEAGALVLGTLHTGGAAETVLRVEGMFPVGQRDAIRDRLAGAFAGIFSQRLVPAMPTGRVSATEVLLPTAASRNLIRQGKYQQLDAVMMGGAALGMQTEAMALQQRAAEGKISAAVQREYLEQRRRRSL